MPPRSSLSPSETTTVQSPRRWPLVVVLIILVLLGGGLYAKKTGWLFSGQTDGYQAVFLTNGQVYFGKVSSRGGAYVTLTDIYYLRQNPRLQEPAPPADEAKEKKTESEKRPAEPEISLIKFGQELHGPKDRMDINRNHILFIEDLQDDGKVVQAIQQYKEKQ